MAKKKMSKGKGESAGEEREEQKLMRIWENKFHNSKRAKRGMKKMSKKFGGKRARKG